MLKSILLVAAAATVLVPSVASARDHGNRDGRRGYSSAYGNGYRGQVYRNSSRVRVVTNYGYGYPAYGYGGGYGSYGGGYGSYGYGYPAYGYSSYGSGYGYPAYGYNSYGSGYGYCRGNGAAGAVIGGVAGAAIGSQVADGGHRYSRRGYRRSGNGAAGAIVGAAIGAIAGGALASSGC